MRAQRERSNPSQGRLLSETTEDHLERIGALISSKGYARVSDLAESLKLSKSTVSNMLQRLSREGFVNYERYRGISLTPAGQTIAFAVVSRHQLLEQFLEIIGVSPEVAAHDIEGLEHHLSPETLKRLKVLLEHLQRHPLPIKAGQTE